MLFDIFDFSNQVGRGKTLPLLTVDTLHQLGLLPIVDEARLLSFLEKIQQSYRQDVQYHNDLHGVDVAQMGFYFIKHCQLHEILNLNMLDCLSFIIAGVCHDVGHDGLTNSYHSNAVTKRAIESNDIAV